jgi:hypothetical protein
MGDHWETIWSSAEPSLGPWVSWESGSGLRVSTSVSGISKEEFGGVVISQTTWESGRTIWEDGSRFSDIVKSSQLTII